MPNDAPIPTTRDRPGSYDAIATAKADEPLFPLQGGDPFAPPTVRFWAHLCREAGMTAEKPEEAERLLRKATDAEQISWAMQAYQKGQAPVEGERAHYTDSGRAMTANDARLLRESLIGGTKRLHNALSEALAVADVLARHRVCPTEEVQIREAAAALKEAAFLIEPRRGTERS